MGLVSEQGLEESLRRWAGAILAGGGTVESPPERDAFRIRRILMRQGVHAAVFDAGGRYRQPPFPPQLAELLRIDCRHLAGVELARAEEFVRVLQLAENRLSQPLLIVKGAALAHQIYPHPHLRVRGDIDALVNIKLVREVSELLTELGYAAQLAIDGSVIMQQRSYTKTDVCRVPHTWDVHWQLSNRPIFAGALTYDDLLERALEVYSEGHAFLAPNLVDALLIACLHLMGHHSASTRLIWLYDIHLLVGSLSETEYTEFLGKARRTPQVQSACHAALALTRWYISSEATGEMCRALNSNSAKRWSLGQSYAARLLGDARALDTRNRFRFVRQHLFPSRDYMMKRFGFERRWQLPFWYGVRIARAATKLFKRR